MFGLLDLCENGAWQPLDLLPKEKPAIPLFVKFVDGSTGFGWLGHGILTGWSYTSVHCVVPIKEDHITHFMLLETLERVTRAIDPLVESLMWFFGRPDEAAERVARRALHKADEIIRGKQ